MKIGHLYIAEKPSVGKAIAENLGGKVEAVKPGSSGRTTHYVVGEDVVTWVFGHILELAEPEDYNEAFKGSWAESSALLPILPPQWKLKPVASAKDQLKVIQSLLKSAQCVVHAGDPDREGQLLVDEVLEFLGNQLPVKRILPNAIDDRSMKKILSSVQDNGQFQGLYRAGIGRQRADWLIGMNMTRACTTANQRSGMRGTLSVGRVQTPTLAMVVKRDLEIEGFQPQTYFDMSADFAHPAGSYTGAWVAPKGAAGLDREGRLLDMKVAAAIKADCEGKSAQILDYKVEDRTQSPPLPFSLSTLQKKASELYKMGAKQVLELCQSLYEKKIATYPRTDCTYLPEDQLADAPRVLAALGAFDAELGAWAQKADARIRPASFNSKKVTAHHAIVPTGETRFESLSEPERKIFGLIVRQYVAQFFPDYSYRQTTVQTRCGTHEFRSNGRTPVDLGWRRVFGAEERAQKEAAAKEAATADASQQEQVLPAMHKGDLVKCARVFSVKKQTKPPARFTEGTLIHGMTNVHETVSDAEIKRKLKEVKGIGTEATRGDVIETLKERMFISEKIERGKLVSTPAGRALIQALPKDLTDVTLTALWENALDQIERGAMPLERFIEGQSQWIRKLTRQALEAKISVAVGFLNEASAQAASAGAGAACPTCGQGHMRVVQAKAGPNKGNHFLSCSNYPDCKHTQEIEGQDEPRKKGGSGSKRGGKK